MRFLFSSCFCLAVCLASSASAQISTADEVSLPATSTATTEPFSFGDFTWLNGANRQKSALLDSKYFTGSFLLDVNYTASLAHPVDDTVVGSTALARNNEVQVSFVGIGGDFHFDGARARFMTQFGTRATVVPRNDTSADRGQFDLRTAYRYLSEAYGGYHWDVLHGVNLDVGIFMSYVGLMSYAAFENWAYQPSFTSDNTPWFFNGARLQVFPTDRLKVELWLINGWQTYGKFNDLPGIGAQILWRPREEFSVLANAYVGTDSAGHPGRWRFHSDNSVLVRYWNRAGSFLNRAAFSITGDIGWESGDGVSAWGGSGGPAQNFLSAMAYHRVWFSEDHFAWTVGGGFIHNPGRYLTLVPTGVAGSQFDTSPGSSFDGWDISTTLDWMPRDWLTWRLEWVHREASVPYFAGHGGVTSPDGYTTTALPPSWTPDQVRYETRGIGALLVRF